jgi:hypothetical protein
MTDLTVNGKKFRSTPTATPLLWVLREALGLTGTRVRLRRRSGAHGAPRRRGDPLLRAPLARRRQSVTTTRGSRPTRRSFAGGIAEEVPQWARQSGQIMSAAILLRDCPKPTDKDVDDCMSGNICRCGTYQRIRKAIHLAAKMKAGGTKK